MKPWIISQQHSQQLQVEVIWDRIPVFPGVLQYASDGILPGAVERNKESCSRYVQCDQTLSQEMIDICYDAQTSGGLLVAIEAERADDFLNELYDTGVVEAAVIGKVVDSGNGAVYLTTDNTRKLPAPRKSKNENANSSPKQIREIVKMTNSEKEEVPCCADAVSPAKPASDEIEQISSKFSDFLHSASSPHGLDAYTKQAMAIALSVVTRCEPCIKMHIKKAKEKGFTQDEIDEAAFNRRYNIGYYYQIEHFPDRTDKVAGSGSKWKKHFFEITSIAKREHLDNSTTEILVTTSKILSEGYN